MSSLKIIQPITIADTMLTASDVPETDYAAWASGTTYALAARVIYQHNVYESLQGSNTGKTPSTATDWWVRVGPTNRWAAFDQSPSSVTSQAESISYTIVPGRIINAVAMLGLSARTVRVRVTDPTDGTVYDKTQNVGGTIEEASWWAYFFGDYVPQTEALFLDLPAYSGGTIIIDIDAGTGTAPAEVGVILLGRLRFPDLQVRYGVELGIVDFSRKERDDFGAVQLVQRGFARRAEFPCHCATASVDSVVNLLASLRAIPCLWIGTELTRTTIVYGWYNDFSVQIAYPKISYCSLEVEGLV